MRYIHIQAFYCYSTSYTLHYIIRYIFHYSTVACYTYMHVLILSQTQRL